MAQSTDIIWQAKANTDSTSIVRLGLWSIGLVFMLFMGWSLFFPIASAVITPGSFVSAGFNKQIQHDAGGTIRAIFVSEGDRLSKNQPVLELDRTAIQADVTRLEARYNSLNALKIRLDAERSGNNPAFPAYDKSANGLALRGTVDTVSSASSLILRGAGGTAFAIAASPQVTHVHQTSHQTEQTLIDGQKQAFQSGRSLLSADIQGLEKRIIGLTRQHDSILARMESQKSLLILSQRELAKVRPLAAEGLVARNKLHERERAALELEGQVSVSRLEASSVKAQIEELEVQIERIRVASSDAASKEYVKIVGQLAEISDQLKAARYAHKNAVVRSPIAGRLTKMSVTTVGGVLGGGDVVGEIVPDSAPLIVQAKVSPGDIDYVKVGQTADIVVTAFNRRVDETLFGRVDYVSADALTDERSNETHFIVQLVLDGKKNAENNRLADIVAGMQAEIYIQTGERTFMTYLVKPIVDSFRKSFREH